MLINVTVFVNIYNYLGSTGFPELKNKSRERKGEMLAESNESLLFSEESPGVPTALLTRKQRAIVPTHTHTFVFPYF